MTLRVTFLIIALVAAYGFLAFHLSQVQLAKNGFYMARAASQRAALMGTTASRGAIYFTDKNGAALPAAVNQNFPIIYAVPSAIADAEEAANALAPVVHMPVAKLTGIFTRPNDSYELLARKAPAAVAQKVTALAVKGVFVDNEPDRFYPLNAVASQVLGFVGPNASGAGESGHYGIEQFYERSLDGASSSGGGAAGRAGAPGADITLTIDPNIQIQAEKILNALVQKSGATGGSVIVEDPRTGKILAMGAVPDFDPNNYASSSYADFLNTNVQSLYEPGSIFKVITMAAGIDTGKITPSTTYTDTGSVTFGKFKITNYDLAKHGAWGPGTTMTNVIEHSINTGAIYAEQKTGNAAFLSYVKNFGFGDRTGLDLPGEVKSNIGGMMPPAGQKAPQANYATAAYGQGVAVTPISLINSMAAIANGGVLMRPYLNAALQPQTVRRVISTSTAAQVTTMMISAVDKAHAANIDGYSLAGKTGSAFIPDFVHGGYTNKLIDSYVGFGPTANPQFVALIRLNTLPSTALAVESVVPAWKQLAQYIINYYNMPPDRIGNK